MITKPFKPKRPAKKKPWWSPSKLFLPDIKALKRLATNDYDNLRPGTWIMPAWKALKKSRSPRMIHPAWLNIKPAVFNTWIIVGAVFVLISPWLFYQGVTSELSFFARLNYFAGAVASAGIGGGWIYRTVVERRKYLRMKEYLRKPPE